MVRSHINFLCVIGRDYIFINIAISPTLVIQLTFGSILEATIYILIILVVNGITIRSIDIE